MTGRWHLGPKWSRPGPAGRSWPAHLADFATAIADLDRAVALQPDDPSLRYNRAFAHQQAGSWAAAWADLEIAAELAPDDEDIAAARAECRLHLTVG